MSSPVTTPSLSLPLRPSFRAASATASAQPCGFTPPALVVTRIPRSTTRGRMRCINGTTSRAYPRLGSRAFCFCRMDIVTSAR